MPPTPRKAATPAAPRKRILVVDDHPLVRRGQSDLIGREPDFEVCAEAGNAREALERMEQLRPDLVVMDLNLPDKDGLELLKDARARWPGLAVLVLSMNDEDVYAPRVLRAGARGYLSKCEAPERLVSAIRTVFEGQIAVSERLSARILESFSAGRESRGPSVEERLSDRELEVAALFGEGWSTDEIAARLCLSSKTVDVHRANVKQKLGLKTTPEFLRWAIRWNSARGKAGTDGLLPAAGGREPVSE